MKSHRMLLLSSRPEPSRGEGKCTGGRFARLLRRFCGHDNAWNKGLGERRPHGACGAQRGARAVRAFSTCAYNFFFPLVLFSAPHHYLPFPCGEPACRGCGIGRQARLRWLSRWRTIATGAVTRQAHHLRSPMKRKRRLPRSRRRDNRNAKRTDTSTPKRLHHGNGHPIEQHVETRNVRNGSTGLGTLWGTRLFGRAAVPESSTSSSSSSYGPPLAGGGGSYNHVW